VSLEEQIREIHEVICKHKPAEDDLMEAAVRVVQTRYSDAQWDELNACIGNLCDVLIKAGVRFNNPRISQ
jgi:hypothetical protein